MDVIILVFIFNKEIKAVVRQKEYKTRGLDFITLSYSAEKIHFFLFLENLLHNLKKDK